MNLASGIHNKTQLLLNWHQWNLDIAPHYIHHNIHTIIQNDIIQCKHEEMNIQRYDKLWKLYIHIMVNDDIIEIWKSLMSANYTRW